MKRLLQDKAVALRKQKQRLLKELEPEYKSARFYESTSKLLLVATSQEDDEVCYLEALCQYLQLSKNLSSYIFVGYTDASNDKYRVFACTDEFATSENITTDLDEAIQLAASNLDGDVKQIVYGSSDIAGEVSNRFDTIAKIVKGKPLETVVLDVDHAAVRALARESFKLVPIETLHGELVKQATSTYLKRSSVVLLLGMAVVGAFIMQRPTVEQVITTHSNPYEDYQLQHKGTALVVALSDAIELIRRVNDMQHLEISSVGFSKSVTSLSLREKQAVSLRSVVDTIESDPRLAFNLGKVPVIHLKDSTSNEEIVAWYRGRKVDAQEVFVDMHTALSLRPQTTMNLINTYSVNNGQVLVAGVTGKGWSIQDLIRFRGMVAEMPIYVNSMTLTSNDGHFSVDVKFKIVGYKA